MSFAADPLLTPFRLRHLTLKNRLMSTSHEPGYGENGMPKDRYRRYHAEKAKGGIALTMTAGSAVVSRDSPAVFGNLHLYDDAIVPWLRDLADACHEHDCKVMIQITHLGRRTAWNTGDWLPVLGPSAVREPAHRAFPKVAEHWDIDRIVADYAAAAQRCQMAGLDGLEFEAYGHLMDQFWSPATNRREDDYGGLLDNRLRFSWRVIEAVRSAVGPDFVVGIRMTADETLKDGLRREEGIEIARRMAASGKVDFLNVIRGSIESDVSLSKVMPLHGTPSSPHLDFAGEVRAETRFPVFHAARINDVATARHAVASGKLDMVGMTRAHIADPYIARMIATGNEHRIRPCVGAGYCIDRGGEGGEALCIHNPSTGREATMPHVIVPTQGRRRSVLVVGAGPAGLEAARVAAERGHHVTLCEAANEAGGQVRLAAKNQRRRELVGIIDWRLAELERLQVDLRFDTWVEAEDVDQHEPDAVIVATGGYPQHPALESGDNLVVSSWDILSGVVPIAENVLLYDDNGAHPGMSAAELIVQNGSRLEIVTPERMFAPDIGPFNHVPYMQAFRRHGARLTITTRVRSVRRDGNELVATLSSDYAPEFREERRVDQIVVEHGTSPMADLYFALVSRSTNGGAVDYQAMIAGRNPFPESQPAGRFVLLRIGDAIQSRNVHAAVYDGLRYGLLL